MFHVEHFIPTTLYRIVLPINLMGSVCVVDPYVGFDQMYTFVSDARVG